MYPFLKRALDVLASGVGLVVLSPLIAAVAVWVVVEDPGPVFYVGRRVGRGGRPFGMYKFRTMVVDADRRGPSSTADDDPRITRAGRFLRRFKLDEIPQLINVFTGDMSLVGPRPQVQWAVDLYTPEQRRVLALRPGITDYASVRFPNEGEILKGSADPDRDYMEKIHPEKMRLQLEYLEKRGFVTDLGIVLQTLAAVLPRRATSGGDEDRAAAAAAPPR